MTQSASLMLSLSLFSLVCAVCKELFDTETERDVHSKQCLYNIPYECSDCKQKFTFLSSLYDHIDETNYKHEKVLQRVYRMN